MRTHLPRRSAFVSLATAALLTINIASTATAAPPTVQTTPEQPVSRGIYPRETPAAQINQSGLPSADAPIKTITTQNGREAVADRLLVRFTQAVTDTDLAQVQQKAASLGAGQARVIARVGRAYLVDVSGATSVEAAARAFVAADARVRSAGPDYIARGQATPNDTDFSKQWNMNKIQAPQAWNRTLGSAQTKIAILDTGVSVSHPDLAGKVIKSKDFVESASGSDDRWGHGTNVAGLAAAATNNSKGVAGVGYNAVLLNGKVLDDTGSGSVFSLIDGVYWAVDNGATVISMSLSGGDSCDPNPLEDLFDTGVNELRDALNYAWSQNVVLVAAASNDGNTTKHWPAACPNVLAVANTDQNDNKVASSSYGTWVDVAAPGANVWSPAAPLGVTCVGGRIGDYAFCGGTSSATPQVAGLASLVQASCGQIGAQAVVDRITSSADKITGTGTFWQHGRINAVKAVCYHKPANFQVIEQKTNAIRVGWTDVTPGESFFEIQHRVTGSATWKSDTVSANDTSLLIPGLTPGTSYDFRVQSCDGAGCTGFTNTITAKALSLFKLTASVGAGAGKVTSNPAGINCGNGSTDCTESYAPNAVVSLAPIPAKGWEFDHWAGACTGNKACSVTMSAARTVQVFFVPSTEPAPPSCPPSLPNCQEQ